MASNPEFCRAERFDGMFFFDLPREKEREAIWSIYNKLFEIKKPPTTAKLIEMSDQWTGAEIRTCCRLSALLEEPIEKVAETIVPIIKTAADRLDTLRTWADGRCMSSSIPGLFRKPTDTKETSLTAAGRKVTRD